MFGKSRRRIVTAVFLSLFLLLSSTAAVLYITCYYVVGKRIDARLENYVLQYTLPARDAAGQPGQTEGQQQKHTPYGIFSVAFDASGAVLDVSFGRPYQSASEALENTARAALAKKQAAGKIGAFRYLRASLPDCSLVCLWDTAALQDIMVAVAESTLLVGAVILLLIFIASIPISRYIVRPLEENDRRQKQFVSDAGHELKTPVSVIDANAALLSRKVGENEWISNIRYECSRLASLVSQLILLSRAQTRPPAKETIDLTRLLIGEALPFEGVAFEHDLTMRSDLEERVLIEGDPESLRQLISILVDNAISHAAPPGEIFFSLHQTHRSAVLRVENPARDLPPETLLRLTDRFYRSDPVRNSESGHYGLGLAIAAGIAQAHKAEMTLASENGRFSVTLTFPQHKPAR